MSRTGAVVGEVLIALGVVAEELAFLSVQPVAVDFESLGHGVDSVEPYRDFRVGLVHRVVQYSEGSGREKSAVGREEFGGRADEDEVDVFS
jgi:hypothetical protein